MAEDEIVRQHHRLRGYEFVQTLGDGDGQGSLAWFSPWGRKESNTPEQLSSNKLLSVIYSRESRPEEHAHVLTVVSGGAELEPPLQSLGMEPLL